MREFIERGNIFEQGQFKWKLDSSGEDEATAEDQEPPSKRNSDDNVPQPQQDVSHMQSNNDVTGMEGSCLDPTSPTLPRPVPARATAASLLMSSDEDQEWEEIVKFDSGLTSTETATSTMTERAALAASRDTSASNTGAAAPAVSATRVHVLRAPRAVAVTRGSGGEDHQSNDASSSPEIEVASRRNPSRNARATRQFQFPSEDAPGNDAPAHDTLGDDGATDATSTSKEEFSWNSE